MDVTQAHLLLLVWLCEMKPLFKQPLAEKLIFLFSFCRMLTSEMLEFPRGKFCQFATSFASLQCGEYMQMYNVEIPPCCLAPRAPRSDAP